MRLRQIVTFAAKRVNFKQIILFFSVINSFFAVKAADLPESFIKFQIELDKPVKQLTNKPERWDLAELPTLAEQYLSQIDDFTPQLSNLIAADVPGAVYIEKFEFTGNTAFSDEELAELVKDYVGREITFAQLLEVEEIIRNKYQAGCNRNDSQKKQPCYINSDAVISPQTIKEGVVTITIVEGTVAEINITGTDHLNPNYVKDRLELAIGTPLDLNELLEALRLLQIDPVIENISAELARGVRPEASILNVTVTEANTFDLSAFANNGRSPSVGSFRRGVSLYHGNVFGLADKFNFAWANTDGSDSFDGSYAIPINARNGEIILTAGYRDTEIIEEPFNRLDILGDSVYYELTYRQPIVQSATKEFALGLTFSRQESSTEVLDTPFPLSRGADEEGETKISAIRLFQEYIKRNPRDVFALRSQFNIGVDVFDASDEEGFPDSNFLSWRGQGQYVRLLDRDTLFVVRTEIQLATDELLALEQFSLGGFNSVRGYRQDFLLTDNAFFASAEVRIPLLRAPEVEGLLQIIPFIDFGVGWNNGIIPDPDPNAIAGIGVGLQWQMGDRLDARIDFGVPLTDTNIEERTWQENGIYFNINYKLF